jgi:hypothetical protein
MLKGEASLRSDMSPISRRFSLNIIFSILALLFLIAVAPNDKQLGSILKIIYLHGAEYCGASPGLKPRSLFY